MGYLSHGLVDAVDKVYAVSGRIVSRKRNGNDKEIVTLTDLPAYTSKSFRWISSGTRGGSAETYVLRALLNGGGHVFQR